MTIDVKAIFARELPLSDLYAERSLLAAILFDQRALDRLPDLELDDFTVWQHGQLFKAIRNVQAGGADVTVDSILAELAHYDRAHDTFALEKLSPCIAETMNARVATDFAPDELRWYFERVRCRRTRRERLAA